VRAGSATGTLLGTATVANTGSWDTFTNVTANLTNVPTATTTLFLVFKGATGQGNLYDLDAFTINGGTTQPPAGTIEGEAFTSQSGVQSAGHAAASGGQTVGYIDSGDWAGYSQVSTSGKTSFTARVSSGGPGGTITIRSGSQTGTVLGTVAVTNTGSFDTFANVSTTPQRNRYRRAVPHLHRWHRLPVRHRHLLAGQHSSPSTTVEGEGVHVHVGRPAGRAHPASGGLTAGHIENGDWAGYSQVTVNGATRITVKYSSAGPGGTIEVRAGSATGTVLGSVAIPPTGNWETFATTSANLTAGSATGQVVLRFTGGAGSLFDVDTFTIRSR